MATEARMVRVDVDVHERLREIHDATGIPIQRLASVAIDHYDFRKLEQMSDELKRDE